MPFAAGSLVRLRPRHRIVRCLLGVGVVALATLLRFALDPLIHDHSPYSLYVGAVVIAAWLCGMLGGIISTIVAAFAANYFFVEPRYEFIPHGQDLLAMGLFSVVSLGLVWFIGRWRRAEATVRDLYRQARMVLEQLPVGVVVADASRTIVFGNSATERVIGRSLVESSTVRDFRDHHEYEASGVDGSSLHPEDAPMSRALHGETVADEEIHITQRDGTRRIASVFASPLRREDRQIIGAVVALLDVTERKRIEEDLLQREEELRVATLAADVGVWAWTPGTSRVSVGANWRTVFGVHPDPGVTLDTWADSLHPDDRERVVESLNAAWRDQREFRSEYRVASPDGSVRWVIDRGRPFSDASGNVIGMTGINVDITERKASEEALRDANRLKDEFLATLSHELRTPLNAIVGWSDMLRRGNLQTQDMQRASDSIYRNAKVQSEIINDVLDVSRIISGKVQIDTQPVDLAAVLKSATESVLPAADAKGVAIVTDVGRVPYPVGGDATRLQQVFWNLLSNAVKFTPSGGQVSVGLRFGERQVQVQVSDTGIGIAPDFVPHVFERFRQKDSSSTRKHGGLGLGLAIVRHLVELHGGTVQAESAGEGKGSTFTLTLPAHRFEERRHEERAVVRRVPPVEPVPDDVPTLCGVRVLVVDDERDTREVAASVLRQHGAHVAVAANGMQALEQFDLFDPNVLLVDLAMPDMDGFALIERIRTLSGPKGMAVPAIAFTAYAREEDERRVLSNGFQRHLAKPVDSHALAWISMDHHLPNRGPTGRAGVAA